MKLTFFENLLITGKNARYDKEALAILSDKSIMAPLLKEVVPEVKNYSVEEIMTFIEGEPKIKKVGLHPNTKILPRIVGRANESKILNEGTFRFDLWFNLDVPTENDKIRIIINVEAQGKKHPGYSLATRAIYYTCRLVSEQYGTEFDHSNYDGIKKVYSIWICMPKENKGETSIESYSINRTQEYGKCDPAITAKERYDILKAVIIRLGQKKADNNKLLNALSTIFSDKINGEDKVKVCAEEGFPIDGADLQERITTMSGLGKDIELEAREKATAEEKAEGLEATVNMLRKLVKTPEEAYNLIKDEGHYNVSFETVKQLFEKK